MQSISESPRGLKPRPPEAVVDFFRAFALFYSDLANVDRWMKIKRWRRGLCVIFEFSPSCNGLSYDLISALDLDCVTK